MHGGGGKGGYSKLNSEYSKPVRTSSCTMYTLVQTGSCANTEKTNLQFIYIREFLVHFHINMV